ncbi:MAG: SMC-Scp complex subunit ScpB [Alphaproteobacteria bacterium]|nr:SMC-Scp complex subunit ScpB [Alphaproteobacteria bacterium]
MSPDGAIVSDIEFTVRLVEALLFASQKPLSEEDLAERLPEGTDVKAVLAQIAELYANRGVALTEVAGGWAIRTAPDLAQALRISVEVPRKLSRAAIEALSIIAYHQPVTRGEIEEIRGVALSKGTLDVLLEAGWIKPRGHKQTPGRPALWVTTDEFLLHFGLASVDDLPGVEELKAAGLLDRRPSFTTLAMREDEKEPVEPADDEEAEIRAERDEAAAADLDGDAADDDEAAELEAADDDDEDADDEDDDDDDDDDASSRAADIAASPVREPV